MTIRITGLLMMILLLGSCGDPVPDNEHTAAVVPYPAKIVCLGGDWTIGTGLAPEQAYPALLAEAFEGEVKVVNAGIKGESVQGAAVRIDWILQQRLSTLLLAYGLETEQAEAWETLLRKVRNARPALEILVLNTGLPSRKEALPPAIRDLMEKYEVRILNATLPPVGEMPELWQADGRLPSAEGQRRLAERLRGEINVSTEQSGS